MKKVIILVLWFLSTPTYSNSITRGEDLSALDVIIVYDNSGSMIGNTGIIENHINDNFYAILETYYDVHVILISNDSVSSLGICIPAPLGSGSCPSDEKLPKYKHVVQTVNSREALQLVISTHDLWDQSLRAGSQRVIIAITDGNSNIGVDTFMDDLVALDNEFSDFQFHAFATPPADGCTNNPSMDSVYKQLAEISGGLFHSIDNQTPETGWINSALNIPFAIFKSKFECLGY